MTYERDLVHHLDRIATALEGIQSSVAEANVLAAETNEDDPTFRLAAAVEKAVHGRWTLRPGVRGMTSVTRDPR